MDTTNYVYNGKKYKPSPTVLDSNTFFHAAFGIRIAESDTYLDKKATFRRIRWASFLAYFEDDVIPSLLADVLDKCLTVHNKYEHASVEDQDCLKDYISDITKAEQGITVEEIPVLATLENIKIVLFVNGRPDPLVINPNIGILGSYPSNEQFKGEVILCLDGNLFSRLNLIEEGFSRSLEDVVAEVKQDEATTAPHFNTGSTKYKKGGSAGSEGVQFQVGLLTVFFLNALRKLWNWRLSTENTAAGKFDDVVLEWPEGATLLQAKHKQSKTKKVTLDDLTSANSKNDDFSLPKYFLSFELVKRAFPLKNLIICTNASVDGKAMRFLEAQDVPFESMLHWKDYECKFYTFKDDILPYLKEGVKSYYEKNSRDKNVDESTVTDDSMKDFLWSLQFYSGYPAGNGIRKVTEDLLSLLKSSKSPYGEMTPLEVHTKILEWFQQKEGVYLTEFSAKIIFSEICRDRIWQKLEQYNIFFRENFTFRVSNRIFHVIAEGGYHLLQELRIFRALQQDKNNILYVKYDEGIMQRDSIDAFQSPKYTILIIVWSEIGEESVKEEICLKLAHILAKFTYKKVILVTHHSNTFPQLVSQSNYGLINKTVSLENLEKKTQEVLLEKKCIVFQGSDVSLKELLATQATEDYGTFLDSEGLEKLIRGEKIKVGVPQSDLNEYVTHRYIRRKFKKASRSINDLIFSEETICETNETVVLISDSAGTGKSVVLTSLAARIKKMNPLLWVLRIDLNHYTQVLREYLNTRKKTIHIVDLLNSKRSTKLRNHLEKSVFSMKEKVVLMLDGFDEISPDFTQLALSLLSVCHGQRNFAKLFVTTRPHMAKELEETLQVKSFSLGPFAQQDQTDYLTSYWVHNLDVSDTEKPKCEQYAKALMRRMSSWMMLDQQMSNSFVAIPLHVRMLAEIFQASNQLKDLTDWEGCKEFLTADRLEPKLPDDMNVTRLYKMFLEKKRSVFVAKGNPTSNTAANEALLNQFEKCLTCHRSVALELILHEGHSKLFSCYRQTPETMRANILKIGIVQKLGPSPLFVHRTFAEYFVAESLVDELKHSNGDAKFQKLLIEEILFESAFNDIRVFFDGFLQQMVDELPSTVFKEYQASSYLLPTNMRQLNLLHNLAEEGYVAILKLILNCMNSSCVNSESVTEVIEYFKKPTRENLPGQFYSNVLNFLHICIHLNGLNFTPPFGDKILLECAAQVGRLEMVKFLVTQGADVNAGEYKPLSLAHSFDHFEVYMFLVERGAQTDDFRYPAYMAVETNHRLTATWLLDSMLERESSEYPLIAYMAAYLGRADVLEEQMRRGLDINSRVYQAETLVFGAARGEQLEIIRYLVREGCNVNARDLQNNTALMMPIRPSVAQVLVELGIEVDAANYNAETALYIAVNRFDFDLAEVLVRSGANVNLRDERGRTPICIAAMNLPVRLPLHANVSTHPDSCSTQLNTVRLLMENGADANIKDYHGATPLHLAVASGPLDAVALLMEYKIDVNAGDKDGRTALHIALLWNHPDIAKFLVQRNADTNIRDNSGRTIVHYLASLTYNLYSLRDRLDVLRLALKSDGLVDTRDNEGCTALLLATKTDFLEGVVLLVESGADINARDQKGNTALHLAVDPKLVEYLARSGADVTAKNNIGHTALHLAAKKRLVTLRGNETSSIKKRPCLEIAKILVSHSDYVVDIKDQTGCTALHLSAVVGNLEMVRLLIENNADIQVRDFSGCTALHLAAERGQADVVELLLDFGVDVKAKDSEGCTALQLATRKRRLGAVNVLERVRQETEADVNLGDHSGAQCGN